MNEVMNLTTVNDLANKELKKSCKAILNELNKVSHSAWVIARKYADICNDETWKEDFATFKDFANYVSVNRTTLQLYTKAVRFLNDVTTDNEERVRYFESNFTVSKTIEFTRLYSLVTDSVTIISAFNMFIDYVGSVETLTSMSNKEVRNAVIEFENMHTNDTAYTDDTSDTTDTDDTDTTTDTAVESVDLLLTYEATTENVNDLFKSITNLLKEHGKLNISISL